MTEMFQRPISYDQNVSAKKKTRPDASNNSQLVVCSSIAVCPYLTRIAFPSQSFSEKERLFCTTLVALK